MNVDFVNWGVGSTGADLLAQIPVTPTTSDEVMLDNVRSSLARKLPVVRDFPAHDRLLSVAGGGPSLEDTWRDLKDVVVSVNGSLQFLLDKGVKPWAVAVMDPGAQMKDIVPRVNGVKYFIASVCDPSLFDYLEGMEIGLWHPGGCPGLLELLEERGKRFTMVSGGSTMGVRWLNLGYTLGFRDFALHGLDSSYRGERTHAYPDHTDGADHLIIHGYHTKLAFIRQVSDFWSMIDVFAERDVEPITIEMYGDGWLQERWAEFRALNPDAFRFKATTPDVEKRKYERMWEVDIYRKNSPGEHLVDGAIDELGIEPGHSVIDFGCGPARATQYLQDFGCEVLGIDIAENCRDKGVNIPFRLACLWALPDDIDPADWGYCCDVMEHIPPEHVDAVLAGIRRLSARGAFFNIAFFNDGFGNVIGERLHLTVRGLKWWIAKLKEHWSTVEVVDSVTDTLPRGVFKCLP